MVVRFVVCLAILMCGSFSPTAFGASKKVTLAAEMCNYVLTYDAAKVKKQQLEDTFQLLVMPQWAETFGVSVFAAKDIGAIKIEDVGQQCKASLDKVKALKLVQLDGIEDLRNTVLERIEDSCDFHKALSAGYRAPSALRAYGPAGSCNRFVDALEGKTDVTMMFDSVVKNSCRDNVDEKACLSRQSKSRGNVAEMKIEIQNYGWNNCAVAFMKINRDQERDEAARRTLADAFLKRFKGREVDCEEP
jgi:hypothetical protein